MGISPRSGCNKHERDAHATEAFYPFARPLYNARPLEEPHPFAIVQSMARVGAPDHAGHPQWAGRSAGPGGADGSQNARVPVRVSLAGARSAGPARVSGRI